MSIHKNPGPMPIAARTHCVEFGWNTREKHARAGVAAELIANGRGVPLTQTVIPSQRPHDHEIRRSCNSNNNTRASDCDLRADPLVANVTGERR